MYTIVDVSKCEEIDIDITGARDKVWIKGRDGANWLFKEPKQNAHEHLVERLSYQLCMPIYGLLPHAEVQLSARDGVIGSISKSVLNGLNGYVLYEFRTLIKDGRNWSSATGKTLYEKYGVVYNVQSVQDTIYKINDYIVPYFIRAILFDFLVGNSDRHHSNWGVLYNQRTGDNRFCPLYDSGSGLLSTKPEATILAKLRKQDFLNHAKGLSSMVRHGNTTNSSFGAVLNTIKKEHGGIMREFAAAVKNSWTNEFLYKSIDLLGDLASGNRKKLMYMLLTTSRDELAKIAFS